MLSASDAVKKPSLSRIEVVYRAKNGAPQVTWTSPTGGEYLRAKPRLTWSGQDPDNDRLRYSLSVSDDDGTTWTPVETKDKTASTFEFDSTKLKDGTYRARIQASDEASNPDDPQTDIVVSAPFTVDNTAPQLTANMGASSIQLEPPRPHPEALPRLSQTQRLQFRAPSGAS
jgi:hypothetical protein